MNKKVINTNVSKIQKLAERVLIEVDYIGAAFVEINF